MTCSPHFHPEGTDRRSNMSLACYGGFGGPHNEAGVPSSDVELTLDLVPARMVFRGCKIPLDIEILRLHCLLNGKVPYTIGTLPPPLLWCTLDHLVRIPDPVTYSPDSCTSIPVAIFNALMCSSLSVAHCRRHPIQ